MTIEVKQQKAINMALVGIGLVGVVVSILVYLDNKKHAKIKEEVTMLDKQIKEMDLALKKHELKKTGLA